MGIKWRSVYNTTCILLTVFAAGCLGAGVCRESSSTPCDVNVPCDCCLHGKCYSDIYCSSSYCKNGYWGGRCIRQCPQECVCCDYSFSIRQTCAVCVPGYHGSNCSSNCSEGCKGGICDKVTGNCLECNQGYYGETACNISCPTNCEICDMFTGSCESCVDGYYGTNCYYLCPPNCKNNVCNKETGNCNSCKTGFFDPLCYGKCPEQCLSKRCDDHGNCISCIDGYHGLKCNKTCPASCINTVCKMNNGVCSEGCASNFEGAFCDSCISGKYGAACNKTCSPNCIDSRCRRNDGMCESSCKDGFSDSRFCCTNNSLCEKCSSYTECVHCSNGTYGGYCEKQCSVNCIPANATRKSNCHTKNGSCVYGCQIAFYGDTCETECPFLCNGSCSRLEGKCDSCIEGQFGIYCEHDCSKGCALGQLGISRCYETNGTCAFGCINGYFGDLCISSRHDPAFPVVTTTVSVVAVVMAITIAIAAIIVVRKKKLCRKDKALENSYDSLQRELHATCSLYERPDSRNSPGEHNPVYVNTELR